eukprot:Seg1347.6 transcript_id=Seg1347.6/GoldUCD/mRNA.D3Y31 product="Ribosomal RNA-processing protein 7 A" protein_id=Seg1347.6/GoldUCD/D3Y31
MASLNGFKIIQIAFNKTVESPHLMYFKKHTHQKQNDLTPTDKTIFVVNVPPYCTQKGLENVFGLHGPIKSTFLQDAPGPVQDRPEEKLKDIVQNELYQFKVAYVTFQNSGTVDKLMKKDLTEVVYMSTAKNHVKTGMEKWRLDYKSSYPNPENLQKKVDKYMAEFDQKELKAKEEEERLSKEPDNEGWTLVTHGGRKPGAPPEKISKKDLRKEKKKKQKKELINFYTFQQRETKREHIAELRKKFEEDKKRIELMRAARKFKPF